MCVEFMIAFAAIDIARNSLIFDMHDSQIRSIQNSGLEVDKLAGLLFYIFAGVAYEYFVKPLSKNKEEAFKNGAMMGFLLYMTFDFTNKAIFKNYKWDYAIYDIIWGTILFAFVSYFVYKY